MAGTDFSHLKTFVHYFFFHMLFKIPLNHSLQVNKIFGELLFLRHKGNVQNDSPYLSSSLSVCLHQEVIYLKYKKSMARTPGSGQPLLTHMPGRPNNPSFAYFAVCFALSFCTVVVTPSVSGISSRLTTFNPICAL